MTRRQLVTISFFGLNALLLAAVFSYQLSHQLLTKYPTLFTTDTTAAETRSIQPSDVLIQQVQLPAADLRSLLVPYQITAEQPTGTITIQFQTDAWQNSLTFELPVSQLNKLGLLELPLPEADVTATGVDDQLSLKFAASADVSPDSFVLFFKSNPWLEPHRLQGKLDINQETVASSLIFKPVFAEEIDPSESLNRYQEAQQLVSQKPKIMFPVVLFWLSLSGLCAFVFNAVWDTK